MTNLLIRNFVKNFEDIDDASVRTSYGVLASVVGIICNVFLFIIKFFIGFTMNSISVMADGFNNLSDAASSVIGYVGVKMAEKPADREHPFGHGRMEYVAALIVSFLVIEMGFTFLKSSIGKISNPEEITFEMIPFLILVLSIGVKIWMAFFNRKIGKRIQSKVMLATAADSMGDVITTSTTLCSILIYVLFHINVDALAGILVSLVVMWAGIGIAKDTLQPLLGEAADPAFAKQIQEEVETYDGIVGTHDLMIHNYGPNRSIASIHAEVPRDEDIEVSHEIVDRIEREVSKKLGIFLIIHMDPVELKDEKILGMKETLHEVMKTLDENVTFHDFRVVQGTQQINLIFDIVVPFTYKDEQVKKLKQAIKKKMKEVDPRYHCVITIDKSYIG